MSGRGPGDVAKGQLVSRTNAEARRTKLFEDYLELIDLGYTPLLACDHLDVKPANLERTAYRWGRLDIATPLAAYVAQDKKRRK